MKRSAFTVGISFGDGVRSLLLGSAALLLLSGAFALIRLHNAGKVATLPLLLSLVVLVFLVPALLFKGLAAGRSAMQAGTGRGAAVAGILLNGAMLFLEVVIAVRALVSLRTGV